MQLAHLALAAVFLAAPAFGSDADTMAAAMFAESDAPCGLQLPADALSGFMAKIAPDLNDPQMFMIQRSYWRGEIAAMDDLGRRLHCETVTRLAAKHGLKP